MRLISYRKLACLTLAFDQWRPINRQKKDGNKEAAETKAKMYRRQKELIELIMLMLNRAEKLFGYR